MQNVGTAVARLLREIFMVSLAGGNESVDLPEDLHPAYRVIHCIFTLDRSRNVARETMTFRTETDYANLQFIHDREGKQFKVVIQPPVADKA